MIHQDFLSKNLSPVLANGYGQNVLGSTYNSAQFIYAPPGPLKCQFTQPFGATTNVNPVFIGVPYHQQILQIRASCPRQPEAPQIQIPSPSPPSPPGPPTC